MRKFNKALRQTQKEALPLFQIQIQSTVSTSRCLLFDKIFLESQITGNKEKSYTVGLYRNDFPDSFLVFYKDSTGHYPKEIIWLKDCTFNHGQRHGSNTTVSLLCHGSAFFLRFDNRQAKEVWEKHIQDEMNFLELSRNRSSSQCSSSSGSSISDDGSFTLDKRTVLRRSRGRKSANLQELFMPYDNQTPARGNSSDYL